MFQRALVSVSDKTGLLELIGPLVAEGLEIVSTGGTAKYLRENGFSVKDVSQITQFPEVMGGRVKTLHPNVHMALLARQSDQQVLQQFNVTPFDLVVVNLYPFEQALNDKKSFPELIEKIDVGGPTMLRAAAKNHERVAVLSRPEDYQWFLENRKNWNQEKSRHLAGIVFALTAQYDSLIAQQLNPQFTQEQTIPGRLVQSLRYGENPQQQARWYRFAGPTHGLHEAQIIQGKELSYNNLLDLDAATGLVQSFSEPCAVAVKHNNPCGAAIGENIHDAVARAIKADPVSVFGGIIALNRPVGAESAKILFDIFLECIVAPEFSAEALQIFSKKKNLRLLAWPQMNRQRRTSEFRSVAGGYLVQDCDQVVAGDWQNELSAPQRRDFIFGEKVCAALKSNAIALVASGQTIGLGMGQVNRVDAVKQAIERWQLHHGQIGGEAVVLISDAFFPFSDSIELVAKAGIRLILQPGGSLRDEEVIAAAKKHGIKMLLSGSRHFRH